MPQNQRHKCNSPRSFPEDRILMKPTAKSSDTQTILEHKQTNHDACASAIECISLRWMIPSRLSPFQNQTKYPSKFTWTNSENLADSAVIAPFSTALSLDSSETAFQTTKSLKTEGPNHPDHRSRSNFHGECPSHNPQSHRSK